MNINMKINDIPVIGSVKIKGTVYYIDMKKTIYVQDNGEYNRVTDQETLRMILDYTSPRSIDVI